MVDVSVSGVTHHHHPALCAAITKNITQHGLPLSPKTSPTIVSNHNQSQKHHTHHHHPALFAALTKNITQHGLPLSPKTSPTIVSNHNQHQKHRIHHLMLNESYPQKRVNHDESRIAGDKTAYLQTKYFCSSLKKKWGVLLPRFQTSAILNSILLYNLVFSEPVSKSWFIKELNVTVQNKYCHISRSKILSLPSTISLDD